jgi:hypothetical protein
VGQGFSRCTGGGGSVDFFWPAPHGFYLHELSTRSRAEYEQGQGHGQNEHPARANKAPDGPNRSPARPRGLPEGYQGSSPSQLVGSVVLGGTAAPVVPPAQDLDFTISTGVSPPFGPGHPAQCRKPIPVLLLMRRTSVTTNGS